MKIGELTSFGHNVAHSLASGYCLMVGVYSTDIFREASSSPEGHIVVDFMTGSTSGSAVSADLARTIQKFSKLLPELAERHGLSFSQFKTLSARFGTDPVAGPHFSVTVETLNGRRSVDQYAGFQGTRFGKPRRTKASADPSITPPHTST